MKNNLKKGRHGYWEGLDRGGGCFSLISWIKAEWLDLCMKISARKCPDGHCYWKWHGIGV